MQECVNVPIISDNIVEGSESFFGNLDTSAPRDTVTLNPDETEISIIDGSRKCDNFANVVHVLKFLYYIFLLSFANWLY